MPPPPPAANPFADGEPFEGAAESAGWEEAADVGGPASVAGLLRQLGAAARQHSERAEPDPASPPQPASRRPGAIGRGGGGDGGGGGGGGGGGHRACADGVCGDGGAGGAFAHGMELTASQGAREVAAPQAAPRQPRTRGRVTVRCSLTVGTDGDVRAERYLMPPGGLDDDVL